MPVAIDDLISDEADVTCTWRNHEIKLIYRVSATNRDFYKRQRDLPEEQKYQSEWAIQWLLGGFAPEKPEDEKKNGHKPEQVLIGWDVVDKGGKPVLVSDLSLSTLNTFLLLAMVDAIQTDLLPNSMKNEPSDASSKAGSVTPSK